MIPAQMAELILRSGGLTEWINSDEKRRSGTWSASRTEINDGVAQVTPCHISLPTSAATNVSLPLN